MELLNSLSQKDENCSPPGRWENAADKRRNGAGYNHNNNPPSKLNEQVLGVLNRMSPWSSLGEQFLRLSKNGFSRFHNIFSFLTQAIICLFFLKSILADMCQI